MLLVLNLKRRNLDNFQIIYSRSICCLYLDLLCVCLVMFIFQQVMRGWVGQDEAGRAGEEGGKEELVAAETDWFKRDER